MEKTYLVTFYTQKDKVLRTWEYYTHARSLKSAKELAQNAWYSSHTPHMFNCCASIVGAVPNDRTAATFFVTSLKPVTWGNIKR